MLKYGLSCVKTNVSVHTCICTHGYEGHNPWHTVYKAQNRPVPSMFVMTEFDCSKVTSFFFLV